MLKRMFVGECTHTTSVISQGGIKWICNVLLNGEINQTQTVFTKGDIRKAIHDMLRWEDKCGNISKMAHSARMRDSYWAHFSPTST